MHRKELKLRMSYRHKNHDQTPYFSILKTSDKTIFAVTRYGRISVCVVHWLKLGKLDFSIVLGNSSYHLVDDFDVC